MDPSHELPELSTVYQTLNIKITKDSITLSPSNKPHKYCLIFLHGFAMQIQSFLRVFLSPELIGLLNDFKIYIPQAPLRFSTQFNKHVFSWYNLEQESTLHESVAVIKDVIKKETEILNNDPSKIFIGGFSQGSALSLYIVHTLEEMLGDVLVVGGLVSKVAKLPVQDRLPPITIIHGMKDKVKTWDEAKESFGTLLERRNVKVILIEDMKHDMNYEETRKEMYNFLRERTQVVAVQARL